MTAASRTFRIRQGLDIPVSGRPEQTIHEAPEPRTLALCGADYVGLKPRMRAAEGDRVRLGQPLFEDKHDPAVCYAAPGSGTVVAINRGPRRVLESVVIRRDEDETPGPQFEPLDNPDRQAVADRIQQSGLWTAFRTRPYSRVPHSGSMPRAIFVTAMDTRPLAADPSVVLDGRHEDLAVGLNMLTALTAGTVYLCTAPGMALQFPETERLQRAEFAGPHPAGLPGTHIHLLEPVGAERTVWHIGYQDVLAIGLLFRQGRIDTRRVIALGGPGVTEPRLLATRLGASTDELAAPYARTNTVCRTISGSVLDGRTAEDGFAWLGRYHEQIALIPEGGRRHFLGWWGFWPWRYSAARTFLRQVGHRRRLAFSTSQNGRFSGMLPTRAFEKVMPLDILPSPLFRALMVRDTDQAQALGCLELDEEDLALSEFVCPAKNDYGTALRMNLEQIEREG